MKFSILLIVCFSYFILPAQKSKVITYSMEIKFDSSTIDVMMKETESERNDMDSSKRAQLKVITEGLVKMINDQANQRLEIWQDGDWVQIHF